MPIKRSSPGGDTMPEIADQIFAALTGLGLIAIGLVVRAIIRWGNRRIPMKF